MPVCNRATGANLFQVIDECLRKNEIPRQNVKGFCSDNAAVMVGKRNSVLSRVREATDHQVFDIGCISHIANLCAVALIKCLQEPVEDLLVDTYFWFDKSATRKEDYHEFQEFTDTPNEVIMKHVSTRWLSMQRCVDRILSQWDALQSYFSSIREAERPGRAKRCKDAYSSEGMKLYYKFLSYALVRLNSFNVLFQSEGYITIHLLAKTTALLRTYLGRFFDHQVIVSSDVLDINFEDQSLQVLDEDLDVGTAARRYVCSIEEDCDPALLDRFFSDVRVAYSSAVKKLFEHFPFRNEILRSVVVLDPMKCSSFLEVDVLTLIDRFMKNLSDKEVDDILEEFRRLRFSTELPPFTDNSEIDEWWLNVLDTKSPSGTPLYKNLGYLIRIILILPCDQAPVERVFSMVNEIHTKYRPTIQNSTVCALLTCKVNNKIPCIEMSVSDNLAKQVKSAAMSRNQQITDTIVATLLHCKCR